MKRTNLLARLTAGFMLVAGAVSNAQVAPASASGTATAVNDPDQTIELSPFIVNAETDEAWLATSTLAGSRLNTPLRDTGASISVLTSEFLQDLGVFGLEEAAGYAVNIQLDEGEVKNDNWAMEGFDAGRMKIRGVEATVTRNYFRWGMQSDAYNADRIEENRGPNSILFGLGSAGGVVNTLTKRANLSRDFRRATVMVGSYDSYRGAVDMNQRLLDGKLAVRVNALYSNQGDYRHHAFNDTWRLHLASTWQARERTRFRIDYEIGEIESIGRRPSPAFDGVSPWVAAGAQTFATVQTSSLPAKGITRFNANQRRLTYVDNLGTVYNFQGQNRSVSGEDVILDRGLADYTVNPVGPYNRRDGDLQNLSVFWEEKIGDGTFVELSHNIQIQDRETYMVGQGRNENATLYADPMEVLPDGSPNPFAGGMMFEGGRWNYIPSDQKSHNTRLMISHDLDLGKWGNYRLAGMGEYQWRRDARRIYVEAWEGGPFHANPENDQNQVWRRAYVVPGDWSTYHGGGGPLEAFLQGVPDPTTPGRTLNSTWVGFNQGGQRETYERQTTALLGGHARYFKDRLVLGVGFRKDELKIKTRTGQRHPDTNQWTIDAPGNEFENEKYSGTTRTLGAVGHLTRNISLFYNFSNSLDIPNTAARILPDGRTPGTSTARGQDFGIGLSFFDGRLAGRINRFTVDMIGATGGGFGGTIDNPTVLNDRVLDALLAEGIISTQEADARSFFTNNSTIDRKLEGYEFNLTGALTKNWRVTTSYSYTDGYDSNIAPEVKAWAPEALAWYRQWPDVVTGVAGSDGQFMTVEQLVAQWETDVANLRWIREGDTLIGNRKHKASIFTRYSFDRGPLNGLFVGAGYRYQSKPVLGFDNNRERQYGPSQGDADGLIGYRFHKDMWFMKGASIQLNIRNLLNETEPRITNLRGDNIRVRNARIVEPRSWRLTANFEF